MPTKPLIGVQVLDYPTKTAVKYMQELGIGITIGKLNWGEVEPKLGKRDFSRVKSWKKIEKAAGYLPEMVYTLYPIHMNERGPLPEEVRQAPFDSPQMIEAFEGFIAEVADKAGWKEGSPIVLIGNEVDIFSDTHPEETDPAIEFLGKAADVVRKHAPNARVCHALTYDTLKKPHGPALIKRINENADLYCFTYYGLTEEIGVGMVPLEKVVQEMIDAAEGKPVLIVEIGLPSSEVLGSSEEKQAHRVEEIFDTAALHSYDELIGFIWLTIDDWPVEPIREFVKQQFEAFADNENFLAFLTSNGIRRHDGTPKAGYEAWQKRVSG